MIWYLMFIGSIIIVGPFSLFVSISIPSLPYNDVAIPGYKTSLEAPHKSAPIVDLLYSYGVPGTEEEYPRTAAGPSFAYLFRASSECGHGGMSIWMTLAKSTDLFARVVSSALHI